jgi:hypothetical protein
MARRHTGLLRTFLENVAYNGFGSEPKEFFLRAYGAKQQRFTVAVREHINEEWEDIVETLKEEINLDLTGVTLKFAETPKGLILVARDNLFWED